MDDTETITNTTMIKIDQNDDTKVILCICGTDSVRRWTGGIVDIFKKLFSSLTSCFKSGSKAASGAAAAI